MTIVPADHLLDQRFQSDATPVGHIYADNWGLYLFKYIPILTGNIEGSGSLRIPRLFSDTVRVELLVEKVAREAQRHDGTILTDLRTRDRSHWLAFFPILWLNEFEVSANASHPTGRSAAQAAPRIQARPE